MLRKFCIIQYVKKMHSIQAMFITLFSCYYKAAFKLCGRTPWPTINDIVDCSYTIHASFNQGNDLFESNTGKQCGAMSLIGTLLLSYVLNF